MATLFPIRKGTMYWFLLKTARCQTVFPFWSWTFGLALYSTNSWTKSQQPTPAARNNEVKLLKWGLSNMRYGVPPLYSLVIMRLKLSNKIKSGILPYWSNPWGFTPSQWLRAKGDGFQLQTTHYFIVWGNLCSSLEKKYMATPPECAW